jgi:hypothetical protein
MTGHAAGTGREQGERRGEESNGQIMVTGLERVGDKAIPRFYFKIYGCGYPAEVLRLLFFFFLFEFTLFAALALAEALATASAFRRPCLGL